MDPKALTQFDLVRDRRTGPTIRNATALFQTYACSNLVEFVSVDSMVLDDSGVFDRDEGAGLIVKANLPLDSIDAQVRLGRTPQRGAN
jgi:hypothetical protein